MPLVFRGNCSHCGYESPDVSAGGFVVFVTDREEDARRRQGETLPVVTHPFAEYVLEEFGLSFHSTAWGGQFVEVQNLVCRDCGRVTQHRRLTAGGVAIGCGGCAGIGAMGLVLGIAVGFFVANPFVGAGLGIALCVLLATGIEFRANRLVRWRYRERAEAVDTTRMCHHCGGWNCVPSAPAAAARSPAPSAAKRRCGWSPSPAPAERTAAVPAAHLGVSGNLSGVRERSGRDGRGPGRALLSHHCA